MKRILWPLCALAVILVISTTQAQADTISIVNGSFETGDFTGWTLEHTVVPPNFGFSLVRPQASIVSQTLGRTGILNPSQGNFLALMVTGGVGMFNPSGGVAFIDGVRQSIFLNKGDSIGGDVAWLNHDVGTQDVGWVKLFLNGGEVANPFYGVSGYNCISNPSPPCSPSAGFVQLNGELFVIPYGEIFGWYPGDPCRVSNFCYFPFAASSPGWKTWSFEAPESGVYELEMAVQTHGDGLESSIAYFDNVRQVPEVSPLLLLQVALLGLIVLKRRHSISLASREAAEISL